MKTVNVRDLRNQGGEVIERVSRGASVVVTKGGTAVAELRPIPKEALDRATLLARFRRLPPVDPLQLKKDLDRIVDPGL